MKKIITTAMIAIFMASSAPVLVSATSDEPERQMIPERYTEPLKGRKRVPRMGEVFFCYDNLSGICRITFPSRLGALSIILEDESGFTFYGEVTCEDPTWQVSLPSGEYHITCTAPDGSVYEGLVYV